MSRRLMVSLLWLLLSSALFSALPGTLISNSATVDYRIGDLDKNLTTNEVNLTVAQTPAQIEWLRYDPAGTPEELEPTSYESSGGTVTMPPAVLPGGTTITPPATIGVSPADHYAQEDLGIIRLRDLDRDIDASVQDRVDLNITNPRTGEIEELYLLETGPNTGVFVGYIQLVPGAVTAGDGVLSVAGGDDIEARYIDNGTLNPVEAEATIVAAASPLLTVKKQSKDTASIGEFVQYTVIVTNQSQNAVAQVTIEDRLPPGLKYQAGSFRAEGVRATPTLSPDGKILSYRVDQIAAGASVEIRYVALIGAGTIDHRAVNRAWARSPYAPRSNIASVTLKITEELYRSKGFILGGVYLAAAEANATAHGGSGIPGVRLYMEDGRYVVTDQKGLYHFMDVANGTHVVQIDTESIKGRYAVAQCEANTRYAGNPASQFVDIYHGAMRRVDFCLRRLPGAGGETALDLRLEKSGPDRLKLTLTLRSEIPVEDPEVFLSLPKGVHYRGGSLSAGKEIREEKGLLIVPLGKGRKTLELDLEGKGAFEGSIRAVLYYDTALEKDRQSPVAELRFRREKRGALRLLDTKEHLVMQSAGTAASAKEGDFDWSQPTHQPQMPDYTPEKVDSLGKKPAIVWPPKGWIPTVPSTRIAVLHSKESKMELKLNGKKVDPLNYEDRFHSSDRSMVIDYYKGVDLAQGPNRIEAVIRGKGGRVLARLSREIYVESRAPVRLEFLPSYSWLVADGKHPPIVAVRFTGPSGHPLRGGLMGVFSTDGRSEPLDRMNGQGSYRIDSEGIAYIRLKPTTKTGETRLTFKMADDKTETLTIRLKPKLRDWIVVGFAEGTVGYRTLHGHAEALQAAGGKKGLYHEGRVAFFAKGRVLGKWLMTLAYDTGRSKDDRKLFDAIDPDAYYTLYGDATEQGSEAPSRRKLYLKLERDQYSLLFGDFHTGLDATELSSYQNSLTGFKGEYDGTNFGLKVFAARSDKLHFRDDLRGDGTRGYYHLSRHPITEGSEEVWIEVRDRHHPQRILSRKSLQRYGDYDIDYDQGTLYFKEPIYSKDEDFNPRYIVVKYETEGSGGEHYTYGGRASWRSDDGRYEAGISYIDEDQGSGHHRLYGTDLTVNLTERDRLKLELAQTRNREEGNLSKGTAKLLEYQHEEDKWTLRAWYREQDSNFGLGEIASSLGGTRQIGAEYTKILSQRWALRTEAYQNRTVDEEGEKSDENVAELSLHYTRESFGASLGYRYANNTETAATHQITASLSQSFLENRLKLTLAHDQSLGSNEDEEYPTRTALSAEYKMDENTSGFVAIERDQGSDGVEWLSRVGLRYRPWEGGEITTGRIFESGGDDGVRIYDTLGLKQSWKLNRSWTLDFGYEKGLSERGNDESFDAFNLSADYHDELRSGRLALSYRFGSDRKWSLDAAYAIEQSDSIGLGFGLEWRQEWLDGGESRDVDTKFAFVYRPVFDKWIILDRLDLKDESDSTGDEEATRTSKLVNNLHLNWHPKAKWHIGLQYGLKYVIDTIDGSKYRSWTDLAGFDISYDFTERWSLGVQGSVLHSYTGKNLDYGGGIYLSTTLMRDTQLSLGYNFAGFDDEDFSTASYRYEGPYLRIRMKFDQQDLKELAKGVLR
ncbi:hypothetical protein [Nitratifractor sp.]